MAAVRDLLTDENIARGERLVRPVVAANGEDVVALNLLASALIAQGKTDEGLDLLAKVAAPLLYITAFFFALGATSG